MPLEDSHIAASARRQLTIATVCLLKRPSRRAKASRWERRREVLVRSLVATGDEWPGRFGSQTREDTSRQLLRAQLSAWTFSNFVGEFSPLQAAPAFCRGVGLSPNTALSVQLR